MPRKQNALSEIPIVDLLWQDSYEPGLVRTVGRALEDIGFLFVRRPNVTAVLPWVYKAFRNFFSLPLETKMRYERPDLMRNLGYTPVDSEIGLFCKKAGPDRTPLPDLKEFYMMGPPDRRTEGGGEHDIWNRPNIWPEECPELEIAMSRLYRELYPVGRTALRVLEAHLGLAPGTFDAMLEDGPTVMRAIHYPPLTAEEIGKVVWACSHTDINLVTVLPASTRSALRIRLRSSNEWISGNAPEDCVLVQTGDMLKAFTNRRIASAVHEVRAPEEVLEEGRYSAALFMHPHSATLLRPGLTAGAMLGERLGAIGLGEGAKAY